MKSLIENFYDTLKSYARPIAKGAATLGLAAAVTIGSAGCSARLAKRAFEVDPKNKKMSEEEYTREFKVTWRDLSKEDRKEVKESIAAAEDSIAATKESPKESRYSRKGKLKAKEPRGEAKTSKCGLDTTITENIDHVVGLYVSPVNEEYDGKIKATKKVIDSLKYFTSPKSIEKLITKLNTEKEAVRSAYNDSIATKQRAIDDLSAIVRENMKTLGRGNNTFQTSQWRYNGDAVRTAKRCFIEAGVPNAENISPTAYIPWGQPGNPEQYNTRVLSQIASDLEAARGPEATQSLEQRKIPAENVVAEVKKMLEIQKADLATRQGNTTGRYDTKIKQLETRKESIKDSTDAEVNTALKKQYETLAELFYKKAEALVAKAEENYVKDQRVAILHKAQGAIEVIHKDYENEKHSELGSKIGSYITNPSLLPVPDWEGCEIDSVPVDSVPVDSVPVESTNFFKKLFSTTLTDTPTVEAEAHATGKPVFGDDAGRNIKSESYVQEYGAEIRVPVHPRVILGANGEIDVQTGDDTYRGIKIGENTNTDGSFQGMLYIPVNDVLRVGAGLGYKGVTEICNDLIIGSELEQKANGAYFVLNLKVGNQGAGENIPGSLEIDFLKSMGWRQYNPDVDTRSFGDDINAYTLVGSANSPTIADFVEIDNEVLSNILGHLFARFRGERNFNENQNIKAEKVGNQYQFGLNAGCRVGIVDINGGVYGILDNSQTFQGSDRKLDKVGKGYIGIRIAPK